MFRATRPTAASTTASWLRASAPKCLLRFVARGEFENEMKQVLGDIYLAEDIGADDIVVMGRQGTTGLIPLIISSQVNDSRHVKFICLLL